MASQSRLYFDKPMYLRGKAAEFPHINGMQELSRSFSQSGMAQGETAEAYGSSLSNASRDISPTSSPALNRLRWDAFQCFSMFFIDFLSTSLIFVEFRSICNGKEKMLSLSVLPWASLRESSSRQSHSPLAAATVSDRRCYARNTSQSILR